MIFQSGLKDLFKKYIYNLSTHYICIIISVKFYINIKNTMLKNIAIVSGGNSGEYEISIRGAEVISKEIDRKKFIPYIINLRGSECNYIDNKGQKHKIDFNDFSLIIDGKKIIFDAIFNIIHGTPGEDGRLQGYFDLIRKPYTSCDLVTSAITFNKNYCNKIVSTFGVYTAKSVYLRYYYANAVDDILAQLSLPVFVKPNLGGSSVGISKVKKREELDNALKIAFKESSEVLVEEFIQGTEITCGVLRINNKITALPITEIVSHKEFFDYEAKYTVGMSDEITPARISKTESDLCSEISVMLFEKLNCKGVIRIDYILKDNIPYFLEINTIPGMTAQSIVPQQAKVYGIELKELISLLIEECIKK